EAEVVHKGRNPIANPSIFGKGPHKRDDTFSLVSAQIEQQRNPQDPRPHYKASPSAPCGKAIIEQDAKTKQCEQHQHVKYSLDNDGRDRVGPVDVIICPEKLGSDNSPKRNGMTLLLKYPIIKTENNCLTFGAASCSSRNFHRTARRMNSTKIKAPPAAI